MVEAGGSEGLTRKVFLRRSGAVSAALLGPSVCATAAARMRRHGRHGDAPIGHLVISCQENRSFDSYFGFAPEVQRRGFGSAPGFSQPDGAGGRRPVFHQTALRSADPRHTWAAAHLQYAGGRMDGFPQSSGGGGAGLFTAGRPPVLL